MSKHLSYFADNVPDYIYLFFKKKKVRLSATISSMYRHRSTFLVEMNLTQLWTPPALWRSVQLWVLLGPPPPPPPVTQPLAITNQGTHPWQCWNKTEIMLAATRDVMNSTVPLPDHHRISKCTIFLSLPHSNLKKRKKRRKKNTRNPPPPPPTTTAYLFTALKKTSHAKNSTLLVMSYYQPSRVLSQQKLHLPLLKPQCNSTQASVKRKSTKWWNACAFRTETEHFVEKYPTFSIYSTCTRNHHAMYEKKK